MNKPSTAQRCVCCGSREFDLHWAKLLRCPRCTHVWADMDLSDEELRRLYSESYFKGDEYLDYERERPALEKNFRLRVNELVRRHPEGGRLWEIGAAYGYFLNAAREDFDAAGCDISEDAARSARESLGISVVAGDYLAMPPPAKPHDVVCLWDTVEHLRQPHLFLKKAVDELRSGGTIVVSTGDIGSLLAGWRKERWRMIHPPTHLHYFTARSLTHLLRRCGCRDVQVKYHWFWRSAEAVAYRLLSHPETKATAGIYRALSGAGLTRFVFPLNTFDVMTVSARKV